jgi:hypothetical protein
MAIDSQGMVAWQPSPDQLGPNLVRLRVQDGQGGDATQEFTIDVQSRLANGRPEIRSVALTAAAVDQVFAYDLDAFDPNGDPLEFLLDEAPEGMSLDPRRGTLRWLPDASQVGAHDVAIRVMDPLGGEDVQQFVVRARAAGANAPPFIRSTPATEVAVGATFLYPFEATDPENDLLSYSLVAAPSGMTIETDSGDVAWTPESGQVGTHVVIIRVVDARGASATQAFEIVVSAGALNRPPVITSEPLFVASVGDRYFYDVQATDPEDQAQRFELVRAPAGMTIDTASGLVQWTPALGDVGTSQVTVAVFDPAGAAAVQSFEISVQPANNVPDITSTAPSTVAGGSVYRYDVAANDPDDEPLIYSLVSGPAGMAIDNFGRVRWITSTGDIGTHDAAARRIHRVSKSRCKTTTGRR